LLPISVDVSDRSRVPGPFPQPRRGCIRKGRLLWPYDGALPLEALEGLVGAPLTVLTSALAHLSDEGVVLVDQSAGTVQLSAETLRELGGARVLH